MSTSTLSSQDSLRLNVLLTQQPKAIRINESTMTIHALTAKGEAKIELHPQTKDENYIRQVKQLLSNHAFGQPEGYPVYISRWTRMGQNTHSKNIHKLLLLAEPEAVTAVTYSPNLTPEIARNAWWLDTNAEHARQMLTNQRIVESDLAPELVCFLMEFLPFEFEPIDVIKTVSLVLQGNLLSEAEKKQLWKEGQRKTNYLIGFLIRDPHHLPTKANPHSDYKAIQQQLKPLLAEQNSYAKHCMFLLEASGQAYLQVILKLFKKMAHQDVVIILFNAFSQHFKTNHKRPSYYHLDSLKEAIHSSQTITQDEANDWYQFYQIMQPNYHDIAMAVKLLSLLDEHILTETFTKSDAIGSVMRRHLSPLLGFIEQSIRPLIAK